MKLNIHKYMFITGHYKPSVRIMDLVSHTILCVLILYMSSETYSLNSTPKDRFFETRFMAILFDLRVFARNLLRGCHQRPIFFIFSI